ncbi:MAG: membrane dipeptidase [Planctomycetes bacterium]|nr:membrane dipeptidase [Planctomycetota bacterium]
MIELHDVWDFHTDIRLLAGENDYRMEYRKKQLDLPTCRQMGGVFSATGRLANAPREKQWAQMEKEVAAIKGFDGLTLVRGPGDVGGGGRQVLHAEGVYFIQEEEHLTDLEKLFAMGFRSLAPMYNEDNPLGGGAKGNPSRGLTPLGKAFIEKAYALGFWLDCAHANHKTQEDMIAVAKALGKPMHFTHGLIGEPALEFFGQRGITLDNLKNLLDTGGLVGLTPHPGFYGWWRNFLNDVATLAQIAPRQAVLGTDYTGVNTPPITFAQYPNSAATPYFAEELAKSHGEEFARNFCGETLRARLLDELPKEA